MALLVAALVAGSIETYRYKLVYMRNAISSNISQATEAILILLLIGAGWNLAACRYYSCIYILWTTTPKPTIFLFAACIVCAVLSLRLDLGTVGTVGVALIGIGTARESVKVGLPVPLLVDIFWR